MAKVTTRRFDPEEFERKADAHEKLAKEAKNSWSRRFHADKANSIRRILFVMGYAKTDSGWTKRKSFIETR